MTEILNQAEPSGLILGENSPDGQLLQPLSGDYSARFPVVELGRFTEALERLSSVEITPGTLFPKEAIATGSEKIRDGQIGVIKSDVGLLVSFKLTDEAYAELASRNDLPPSVGTVQREQPYKFLLAYDSETQQVITRESVRKTGLAERYKLGGVTVDVSHYDPDWQALNGLVTMMIPSEGIGADPEEAARQVEGACQVLFNIDDAFMPPSEMADTAQKTQAYKKHHKLEDVDQALTAGLVRQEVFPGHLALVDPGKHREYEAAHGDILVFHEVASVDDVAGILKNGLLASRERTDRGVLAGGLSVLSDLKYGGADSAYVRMVTANSVKNGKTLDQYGGLAVVLKPTVLDRTDWYAYGSDRYGSTRPDDLRDSLSPGSLFRYIDTNGVNRVEHNNEAMFATGIPPSEVTGIVVSDEDTKLRVMEGLRAAGVETVRGIAVKDFIHVAVTYTDMNAISHRTDSVQPADITNAVA